MELYKVLKPFINKDNGKTYYKGDTAQLLPERAENLRARGFIGGGDTGFNGPRAPVVENAQAISATETAELVAAGVETAEAISPAETAEAKTRKGKRS